MLVPLPNHPRYKGYEVDPLYAPGHSYTSYSEVIRACVNKDRSKQYVDYVREVLVWAQANPKLRLPFHRALLIAKEDYKASKNAE